MISSNQKFAFIGLSTRVADGLAETKPLGDRIWATTKLPVGLDSDWKTWLGSIRAERLEEDCNLVLCASMDSSRPGVLDGENQLLSRTVMRLFDGLMLTGNIELTHIPVLIGGAFQPDGLTVRSISDLRRPLIPAAVEFDEVDAAILAAAYRQMQGRLGFEQTTKYNRVARILHIYDKAVCEENVHERLHQFCRCIEGFILPEIGQTLKQFISRCEVFVGPKHAATLRQLYEMRSKVEHMHEYALPATLSERERRLTVMRMAALAQGLARWCISRFLESPALWPHYASAETLAAFWKLDGDGKSALWGRPIDLAALDNKFDESDMSDQSLGLI